MVLVDTSVLISYFRGKNDDAAKRFESLLDEKIPFGINNYIYQEILQGAANKKEFSLLKDYLENQVFYELENGRESFESAALIYFKCCRKGFTIRKTVDLLIAQTAIENGLFLFHNDRDFDNIAEILPELNFF